MTRRPTRAVKQPQIVDESGTTQVSTSATTQPGTGATPPADTEPNIPAFFDCTWIRHTVGSTMIVFGIVGSSFGIIGLLVIRTTTASDLRHRRTSKPGTSGNRHIFDFLFLGALEAEASFPLIFKPRRGEFVNGKAAWNGLVINTTGRMYCYGGPYLVVNRTKYV